MYHFFVTGQTDGWDQGFYLYDRGRFLEYTNDKIAKAFEVLTETHINTLLSWSCLFAYEGDAHDVRVGTLRSIKEQGRSIRIEFDFTGNIPAIPYAAIKSIAPLLDIRDWEMNRTHFNFIRFSELDAQKQSNSAQKAPASISSLSSSRMRPVQICSSAFNMNCAPSMVSRHCWLRVNNCLAAVAAHNCFKGRPPGGGNP